jgi:hypothetical protein
MTEQDLRKLGLEAVAYMRKYSVNGTDAWVVHSADGTAIAMQNNIHAAMASARHQDLQVVSLH